MNGLPYYKAYPRDFIEGTIGMDFEMKAAYRLVLDLIYMQGGALPDDARYISGLIGCSVKKWNGLRDKLIEASKIEVRDGYLGNLRADKELETLGKFQDKQRENRARPNKNNNLQSPRSDHTEPDTDTEEKKEPKGSSQKKISRRSKLPDDWRLPKDWGEWALEKGLDELSVRREAELFAQHHQSHGKLMADWRKAWQTWVGNHLKWTAEREQSRQKASQPKWQAGEKRVVNGRVQEFMHGHWENRNDLEPADV